MKKVAVRGGQPVTLCEVSDAMGASWGDNDQIVFSEGQGTALFKISAQGGTPELVATHTRFVILPQVLPGGRMALASERMLGIFAISLDDGVRTPLIEGGSDPHYLASGHIVYALRGRLMAAKFDLSSLSVTGAAVPVLDHIRTEVIVGAGQFALSENGTVAYVTGAAADEGQLVWVNRENEEEILPFDPDYFGSFALSPDGTRAAVTVSSGTSDDIWVYNLLLGAQARSRLTRQGDNSAPVWSIDGKKIVFGSNRDGTWGLWMKPADGGTTEKWETANPASFPSGWSPDGSILAYSVRNSETKYDLWLSHRGDKAQDEVFLATPYTEWAAVFSPDGRYVAYTSDESGQSEVYVQPFPPTGEQLQVSDGGGEEPQWSRVNNELFYSKGPRWLSATFSSGSKFTVISRQVIFEGPYLNVSGIGYAVAPDAKRFLVIKDSGPREVHQINIVQNWTVELKDLVPED